ncbi:type I restriction enzyme, S subunit [Desulforamulus putei DSM 12395]|uniref:Type I restriction enzyme, S subunit n=1 Tax=Desulforamulus putei DSM 12395 TaxID=1121429 RepID=A0A1M4ZAE4_9FIRM|nr:restriction endonuclease subunit S [Desulforamulus putei]SHF14955.1 type I restriction enzyme, S subunit [Desulforamulus putei DSM 12395]
MAYKRYEKYKDSGVEWIGEIPEHWNITKLGYRARMIVPMRDKPTEFNGDIPWIRIEDVDGKYIEDSKSEQRVSKELVKKMNLKVYPIGTVLCTCSCNMGTTVIVKRPLISNQTFIGIVPIKDLDSIFLYYAINASSKRLQHLGEGAIQQYLSRHDFEHFKLAFPHKNEQRAIADFLDQKTAQIDSLIADKEKLIQLLQKKRQAIISEAVTQGLNKNVPMKDSGVEWIGEIPEHWEVKRIKHLLVSKKDAIKPGPFGSQLKSEEMKEGEIKVYNQRNVLDNDFINGDNYTSYEKYKELRAFTVYPGDILVTTRGTIGKVGILPQDCEIGILHPCLIRLQVDNSKIISEYLQLIFNNTNIVSNQLFYQSNATTIEVIYSDTLKNIAIPLPNVQEQMLILENINKIYILFDGLIKNIQTQIAKFKEYRQSLISEAVTGKIDVRDFTPNTEGVA